ncbi:MAG: hypothetical protein IJ993_10670 [Akkermansia sp.]|nr:hypothetical protein [Akkermansia sp.]
MRAEVFFFAAYMDKPKKKLLLLTVGYGEGHNTAARALTQVARLRGWEALMVDPCQKSSPRIFEITRKFYQFCVKSAPWIWGITYAQTETADWSTKACAPILSKVTNYLCNLIAEYRPGVILCTYPLYAYMLDYLRTMGKLDVPYGVVVTDSLEISRPWMLTGADVVYLPDEYSEHLVREKFALPQEKLCVGGFPVSIYFDGKQALTHAPCAGDFQIIYGAYAPKRRVRADVRAICQMFPGAKITVIAGTRYNALIRLQNERVTVLEKTDDMPSLFENSHLYIGKAGAATMYEAYAMNLPLIINYAMPGQEQGNLELLQLDGAGRFVETTADLLHMLQALIKDNAALWNRWKTSMNLADRKGGAARIIRDIEKRFLYDD